MPSCMRTHWELRHGKQCCACFTRLSAAVLDADCCFTCHGGPASGPALFTLCTLHMHLLCLLILLFPRKGLWSMSKGEKFPRICFSFLQDTLFSSYCRRVLFVGSTWESRLVVVYFQLFKEKILFSSAFHLSVGKLAIILTPILESNQCCVLPCNIYHVGQTTLRPTWNTNGGQFVWMSVQQMQFCWPSSSGSVKESLKAQTGRAQPHAYPESREVSVSGNAATQGTLIAFAILLDRRNKQAGEIPRCQHHGF